MAILYYSVGVIVCTEVFDHHHLNLDKAGRSLFDLEGSCAWIVADTSIRQLQTRSNFEFEFATAFAFALFSHFRGGTKL